MSDHETDARDALAPLRRIEPTDEAIAAVLAASEQADPASGQSLRRRRFPRPRPRWTTAAGVTAVTAAVLVALLAAPAGFRGGGTDDEQPASAFGVLSTAAANAAQLPTGDGRYGYTRSLVASTFGHRTPFGPASFVSERTVETWIDARSTGVQRFGVKRVIGSSGSPQAQAWKGKGIAGGGSVAGAQRQAVRPDRDVYRQPLPALRRYHSGDGELLALDPAELPTAPAALRQRLAESEDAKAGREENAEDVRSRLVAREIALLADARTPPKVRSALFTLLARTPGGRAEGPGQDARGRRGQRISIAIASRRHGGAIDYRLIVDSGRARLLEWSTIRPLLDAGASKAQAEFDLAEPIGNRTVILEQRRVARAPSLPPVPARCTDGVVPGIPSAYQRPKTLLVAPGDAYGRTASGRRMLAQMRRHGATIVRISAAEKRRFDALRAKDQRGCAGG
jgi:hypothetical protein